jgi:putative component of membrane protein insertase Oxa1/YidC/SpoIIIJ protein YidD
VSLILQPKSWEFGWWCNHLSNVIHWCYHLINSVTPVIIRCYQLMLSPYVIIRCYRRMLSPRFYLLNHLMLSSARCYQLLLSDVILPSFPIFISWVACVIAPCYHLMLGVWLPNVIIS